VRFRSARRAATLGIAALTLAAVASACGSDGGSGGSASGGASGKTIILDTLYRAPNAQNQAAGAQQAAKEEGATVKWVGPTNIDPAAAIKALQDASAAGADGAIVAAFPGDLFRVPIDQTGLPVATIDLYSPGSKAGTHLATDKYGLGVALAEQFAKQMPENAKGIIVGGICVPGLPALVAPQQGFADKITELRPGVTLKGDQPVDGDATKNFSSWQRIIQQNPDALGFVGQCDQDVPNLIKLKKQSGGAKWLTGATSGDSAENIAAVKDGTMVAIIGQNGWNMGYVAMKLLLDQISNGKEMPKGFIDTGLTVITKQNADDVAARVEDPTLNQTEFKDLIQKILSDPQAAMQPYENCRGCGTTFKP